jgi:hypothetical protein
MTVYTQTQKEEQLLVEGLQMGYFTTINRIDAPVEK